VHSTWAKDCDKYFFITKLNNSLSTSVTWEYTEPYPILQPAGHEAEVYDKLTDKVLKTVRAVYRKYSDYDWYVKVWARRIRILKKELQFYYFQADDDTFIFVDNLRDFLETKNSSELLTYGYNFKVLVKDGYQAGGAGNL
jgi:hypothetical protein